MSLTIAIPFYQKHEAFLKIWEALQPQLQGDEVILIDDYSPRQWEDFDFNPEEQGIKVIKPRKKRVPHIYRLNTLRNLGIKKAENDAVAIIDPDCIPNPSFVENAKQVFDPGVLFGGMIDYLDYRDRLLKSDPRSNVDRKSRWVDTVRRGCAYIWGGCMMFSRSRTKPLGWFDKNFNGAWGAEEHDFASKCYHSGIRLRYEAGLQVFHQKHPKKHLDPKYKGMVWKSTLRNRALWKKNMLVHARRLDEVTDYRPETVVLVKVGKNRDSLDQCMENIFRLIAPVKVLMVSTTYVSKEYLQSIRWWKRRWAVDFGSGKNIINDMSNAVRHYAENGYRNMIVVEENAVPTSDGIRRLLSTGKTGGKSGLTLIRMGKADDATSFM